MICSYLCDFWNFLQQTVIIINQATNPYCEVNIIECDLSDEEESIPPNNIPNIAKIINPENINHCLHSRRSTETGIRDNLVSEELFVSTTSVSRLILSLGSMSDIPLTIRWQAFKNVENGYRIWEEGGERREISFQNGST